MNLELINLKNMQMKGLSSETVVEVFDEVIGSMDKARVNNATSVVNYFENVRAINKWSDIYNDIIKMRNDIESEPNFVFIVSGYIHDDTIVDIVHILKSLESCLEDIATSESSLTRMRSILGGLKNLIYTKNQGFINMANICVNNILQLLGIESSDIFQDTNEFIRVTKEILAHTEIKIELLEDLIQELHALNSFYNFNANMTK